MFIENAFSKKPFYETTVYYSRVAKRQQLSVLTTPQSVSFEMFTYGNKVDNMECVAFASTYSLGLCKRWHNSLPLRLFSFPPHCRLLIATVLLHFWLATDTTRTL